jgi:hypothetical protein
VPNFNADIIRKLGKLGIFYLPQLVERCSTDIKNFFSKELGVNIQYNQLKEIYKGLNNIPIIDLKFAVASVDDKNEP